MDKRIISRDPFEFVQNFFLARSSSLAFKCSTLVSKAI
jgi:hypothetical protein